MPFLACGTISPFEAVPQHSNKTRVSLDQKVSTSAKWPPFKALTGKEAMRALHQSLQNNCIWYIFSSQLILLFPSVQPYSLFGSLTSFLQFLAQLIPLCRAAQQYQEEWRMLLGQISLKVVN